MKKPVNWKIIICLLVLSLLAATPIETQAQTYTIEYAGACWNHDPLTVMIDAKKGVDPKYISIVKEAVYAWQDRLRELSGVPSSTPRDTPPFGIVFLTDPPSNHGKGKGGRRSVTADITIILRKKTGAVLGMTRLETYENETFKSADIKMAVYNAMGKPLDEADAFNIAAHEFGHALGLKHSDDPDDLMYPTYDSSTIGYRIYPSSLDIEALTHLYNYGDVGFAEPNLHPIPSEYP